MAPDGSSVVATVPLGGIRTPLEDRIYKEIRSDFRPLNDFIDDTE